jgi:hypothetical protein
MMRWRYGAENRVIALAGNTIEIGDLCYKYGTYVYPVGDPMFHWVKTFLGVAMVKAVGDGQTSVATSGVFEFPIDCDAQVGDFVTAAYRYTGGPSDTETVVSVEPQLLTVCSGDYAIGRIVKGPFLDPPTSYNPNPVRSVLVEIKGR